MPEAVDRQIVAEMWTLARNEPIDACGHFPVRHY